MCFCVVGRAEHRRQACRHGLSRRACSSQVLATATMSRCRMAPLHSNECQQMHACLPPRLAHPRRCPWAEQQWQGLHAVVSILAPHTNACMRRRPRPTRSATGRMPRLPGQPSALSRPAGRARTLGPCSTSHRIALHDFCSQVHFKQASIRLLLAKLGLAVRTFPESMCVPASLRWWLRTVSCFADGRSRWLRGTVCGWWRLLARQ